MILLAPKFEQHQKRVLFLTAPRPDKEEGSPIHFGDNRPPLGLGYLAAYLEKYGHITQITDLYHFGGEATHGNPGCRQEGKFSHLSIDLDYEINKFQPDFIGMYVHTLSYYTACKLAKELKEKYPDIPLMCGGPQPTTLPDTMPEEFDYVVVGEGEYTCLEIVEGRAKGRILQGKRVEVMDSIPFPNYDNFFEKPYNWELELFGREDIAPVVSMNTTRGCPFPCRFCGVQSISGPGYRGISPEPLVGHIEELKKKHGIKGVYFREDNFTVKNSRVDEFCDIVIERGLDIKWTCESRVKNLTPKLIEKMGKAGCVGLYVGVESGSARMLDYMKKAETREDFLEKFPILHANGIQTYTTWIFGLPTETHEDRSHSNDFLHELNPTNYDQFVYIGMPRSSFYTLLDSTNDYEFKEYCGFIYPKGYLSLIESMYGSSDPRVTYVQKLYEKNKVNPVKVKF